MSNRFDTIPERDGETDGRTDGQTNRIGQTDESAIPISRVRMIEKQPNLR